MKTKTYKLYGIYILIAIMLSVNCFSEEVQYKIGYFKLKSTDAPADYAFFAETLPRSFKTVLERENFKTIDVEEMELEDIYNRKKILETGKKIKADLIFCGSYKIVGEGIGAKIELTVLVYDIKGEERVILKTFLGGTGTGMFVMIDEASAVIKREVLDYFKKREEILKEAKERREREEAMSIEERKKQQEEALRASEVRTRYNNSLYLDSHVTDPKTLKIFFYMLFDYTNYKDNTSSSTFKGLTGYLAISTGIVKNLEAGLTVAKLFASSFSGNENFENSFYNPEFFIKWRALQNENHGLNLTGHIGFQPRCGEKEISSTIFSPIINSNSHTLNLSVFIDKTFGNFTPFLSTTLSFAFRTTGKTQFIPIKTMDITGFEKSSDKAVLILYMKLGFEYRPLDWLILQPYLSFARNNEINQIIQEAYSGTPIPVYSYVKPANVFSAGLNLIFTFAKDTSLSCSFQYNIPYKITYGGSALGVMPTNWTELSVKTSYKLFFYFTTVIDFR